MKVDFRANKSSSFFFDSMKPSTSMLSCQIGSDITRQRTADRIARGAHEPNACLALNKRNALHE